MIQTDSKHCWGICHFHGNLWKERWFLTAQGTPIKQGDLVMSLLDALLLPKEISIVHQPGHSKDNTPEAEGNWADEMAKQLAQQEKSKIEIYHLAVDLTSTSKVF